MILVSCLKGQNLPLEQIQMDFKRLSTQRLIMMTSGLSIFSLWGTAQHKACRCLQEKREDMGRSWLGSA